MDTNKMRSDLRASAGRAIAKNPTGGDGNPFPAIAVRAVDVLALLAEVERLAASRSKKERELEQELEVWRNGPSCWTCGDTGDVHDITGEWRGECDCLSAQLINTNRERDQLKAENEDYKSGQERYEQIIEDLKAENEALRKALGEISGQVDGNIRCAVRDVVNCRGDVQDIYGYCDNIDEIIEAAMAKEASQ